MIDRERQKIRHLLVVKDRRGKRVISLEMDTYSLGRSDDSSIILYGSSVSRQHATIMPTSVSHNKLTPFQIIDGNLEGVKSTNGLLINGTKCDSHILKHGDFIEFGNVVKVTYYTLFNLLDREFAEFCAIENNSKISNKSTAASQAVTHTAKNTTDVERQTLIHLASFPELTPHPIIEIDLEGAIIYCNPVANKLFPQLQKLAREHPLISEVSNLIREATVSHLIRKVEFQNKLFEQSIQYLSDEHRVRILMTEITDRQEKAVIQLYSDRLLQKIIAAPNLNFETRVQALLKLGCDLFDLEIGFLGKRQETALKVAAIHQQNPSTCWFKKNKLWKISQDSEDRSIRLFQFTIDDFEPVTLQRFTKLDSYNLFPIDLASNTERIPISSYVGIRVVIGKKTYGILSFLSPTKRINNFEPEKVNFLQVMAQFLAIEIERRQLRLLLKKLLNQKSYSQQIVQDISQPIQELTEIAQQLIDSNLDSPQDSLAEALNNRSESLLFLIHNLLAKSS